MSLDRRRFLTISAASISGVVLGACNADPKSVHPLLAFATRQNERLERTLFRHDEMNHVPGNAKLTGTAFPQYFESHTVPIWDPATHGVWRLEVTGAVHTPLSLSLDQLVAMPRITQTVDHFCVEGWNARAAWTGVRMSDLARAAGVTADAQYVDFKSFDESYRSPGELYHESWDMESAMHPQTLVAYGMDGHFLGPGHGAPARVHSPIKLGYKNTKYLTSIVFQPARNGGYWSDRGYEWYGGT